jgi:hypothetical protein
MSSKLADDFHIDPSRRLRRPALMTSGGGDEQSLRKRLCVTRTRL